MTIKRHHILKFILLLLMTVGVGQVWAGVPFEAVNRLTNNGDGTFTSAHNAGNQYALALADLTGIAGISTKNVVKIEFDCTIPSASRWHIAVGKKATRGTNANGSSQDSYNTTGLIMWLGTSNGANLRVNDGTPNNTAFDQQLHVTFMLDRTSATKYSYTIVNKSNPETVYFSGTDISTAIDQADIIEVYTWQSNSTVTISDVKVFDSFYFNKGEDVMYIEDLEYASPLVNETGLSVTYSISGNSGYLRTESGNAFPYYPIKTTGSDPDDPAQGDPITVTATTTDSHTTSMTLRVKTRREITAAAINDAFHAGNQVGLITSEYVDVNGLTLFFGANMSNTGKDEVQVVRSFNGGYAVTCIDQNGLTSGKITSGATNADKYWGTYYVLQTPTGAENLKDIVITGYFCGNGGLYSLDGATKYVDIPSSGGDLSTVRISRTALSPNTNYVLYCPMNLLALSSLAYTDVVVDFRYGGQRDEGVFFARETVAAPTFIVTTTDDDEITSHYTAQTFTSSNETVATVNASTGVITAAAKGKTVIRCTLHSDNTSLYPDIPITYNLYVTDGTWDINANVGYTSMDGGLSNSQWSLRGGSHNRNKLQSDTDFEYIYNQSGDLYAPAYGLQVKGHCRFTANQFEGGTGSFTMFATGDNASMRIPARRGMVIKITAFASDEETELEIEGVTTLEGEAVNDMFFGKSSSTHTFICNTDQGYVTIYNPNVALQIDILIITAESTLVLRDGNNGETIYVQKGTTSYLNEILNGAGLSLTYEEASDPSNIATVNASTGEVTLTDNYGTVQVRIKYGDTVKKTYTLQVVDLQLVYLSSRIRVIDGVTDTDERGYANDLKQYVTVYTASGTPDATLQGKVEFSVKSCDKSTTTPVVTKSGAGPYTYAFTVYGIGNVVLNVKLGTITKTFTYEVLGVEFDHMNPVIDNSLTSYDLEIISTAGNTIASGGIGDPTISATYGNLNTPTVTKVETVEAGNITKCVLNITGITKKSDTYGSSDYYSSKGGAFVVNLPVTFTDPASVTHTVNVSTVVTVAYSQHIWNFQTDMTSTLPTYGVSGNILGTRPLPNNEEHYYVATDNIDGGTWQYQKRFRSPESNGGYVYAYLKTVDGNNATVINESAGLQIYSTGSMAVSSYATYTDNGFKNDSPTDQDTYWEKDGYKYSKTDTKKELCFKNGCRIVIPNLKAGQQIDCYWHRHDQDHGERLRVSNLLDASGEEITDIYKIAFTGVGHTEKASNGAGSYSFIVKADGDAEIWSVDETWTRIHEIVLHAPTGTNPDTQSSYASTMHDYTQYLFVDDDGAYTVRLDKQPWEVNVHNGGSPTYTIKQDETLNATVTWEDGMPVFHYGSGWGKFYFTLSNCTQDGKYISTWKNYTITVGKKPAQTYPYTWDFTKYKADTKTTIHEKDHVTDYMIIQVRGDKVKTVARATQTWTVASDDYTVNTTSYGGSAYESYYVDGAQLVSQALKAPLPETEGLGFNLPHSPASLKLNMTHTVTAAGGEAEQVGSNYQTWKSSGGLTIGAGGTIIVPRPASDYDQYYIYINSDHKPSSVSQTTDVSGESGADVDNAGQYKYQFLADATGNAEITFNVETVIKAIGVTNEFKPMKQLSGKGWATESRAHAVDFTLDSLLTTNPVQAYAVIERTGNPVYSDDHKKTTVALTDRRFIVPANQGLVLRQTSSVPVAEDYNVPLFPPAVTTAEDPAYQFDLNLMRPNVTSATYSEEIETFHGATYARFLLAQRYMTYKQSNEGTVTWPTIYKSGTVATFYHWHIYSAAEAAAITGESPQPTATSLNTLDANKAYLLLRADQLTYPVWWGKTPSYPVKPRYVGIEGESDWDDDVWEQPEDEVNTRTYTLGGQLVDDAALTPGIYIRNGKKILIR